MSPGVAWCHLVSPSDFGLRSSVLVVSENPEKSHNWQTTNFRAGRRKSGPDDPTGLEHLGGKEGRMEGGKDGLKKGVKKGWKNEERMREEWREERREEWRDFEP